MRREKEVKEEDRRRAEYSGKSKRRNCKKTWT